jgi:hypothetical protein
MMTETPQVANRVVRRGTSTRPKGFEFQKDMVRLDNLTPYLQQYREDAWEKYCSHALPNPNDVAWRRTEIRGLNPEVYKIPDLENSGDFADIPKNYFESLTGEEHGGQVIMMAGRTSLLQKAE